MKTIIVSTLAAATLSLFAATAQAETLTAWVTGNLNMRAKPNTWSAVQITIPKHSKVELVECIEDSYGVTTWCKTHWHSKWGWLSAKYLTDEKPQKKAPVLIKQPTYTAPKSTTYSNSY